MRIFRYFSVLCRPWCRPLASSSILPCDDLTVTLELEPSPPGMQAGNVICLSLKNQVVLRCEKRACAFSSPFKKRRRAKEPAWIIKHEFCQIKS